MFMLSKRSGILQEIKRLSAVPVFLVLLILLSCQSESPDKSTKIKIGYQEIALYRHLFTAKAKGYFDDEGVNVELHPFVSANQMIIAMISGDLDGTGLTNIQAGLSAEGKDPGLFKIVNFLVWRGQSFPDYILARKDVKIDSLKDLEGKTVGLHPGSAIAAFARTVMLQENVDISKVFTLELKPPTMKDAILAKRIEALYCMDPIATILLESGECYIVSSNPMKYIFPEPVPIAGTALSSGLLKKHPEAARKITRALQRAIEYMREEGHTEEVAAYIAAYTPIDSALALKMNNSEYWTTSEINVERVQDLADRFFELGIVADSIAVSQILVDSGFAN